MSRTFQIFILSFTLFSSSLTTRGQVKVDSYVSELNSIIKPIEIDAKGQIIKTGVPSSILRDKSIIGLGESTHGTKEFYQFKASIIKELISNGKLKIIAMETDYCYAKPLNTFLLSNTNDSLSKIRSNTGLYGIYQTEEVFQMLAWIKNYNMSKPKMERVQVIGVDMQDPIIISQQILEQFHELKAMDISLYNQLMAFKESFGNTNSFKMDNAEKAKYRDMAIKIKALVTNDKIENYKELITLTRMLSQTIELRGTFGTFTNYFNGFEERRDKFMAENAMIIYNGEVKIKNEQMVIWGHNGHIAHALLNGVKKMGAYLKDQLGDKYFALGGIFDEGSVRIFDFANTYKYKSFHYATSQNQNAIEYIFKKSRTPNFFISTRDVVKNDKLTSLVKDYKYSRIIGSTYRKDPKGDFFKVPFTECFDGVFFFMVANAAENVK
ncbi:erythromycin esterase family protein [Pedobacter aquatilis]|uniref:erythromycin esterase family protein n=1 Tax=Pedobacter aquatilis TaxID=351343 RepID=UPI0025B3CEA8|nr:erythromycin esterase family protein [Pedobacter aquatilis]MDN3586982.1 erythromycin esterase family protein [Pedobacter aquatilis]